MGKEVIEEVKKKLALMRKIETSGFSDQQKAAEYFQEKRNYS
jgi:hypothetical protein